MGFVCSFPPAKEIKEQKRRLSLKVPKESRYLEQEWGLSLEKP